MQQTGKAIEIGSVSMIRENKRFHEDHEVWYDPEAREAMKLAFRPAQNVAMSV